MNYLRLKALFFFLLFSSASLFGQDTSTNQSSQDLDTVQIFSNKALHIKEVGFHQSKSFFYRLFNSKVVYQSNNYPQNYSPAVYIKYPDKNQNKIFINSIFLRIRSASKPMKFRLSLYSFNKSKNKVLKKIFQKEIVIDDSHKIKEIALNINRFKFPKPGILIQVEGVDKTPFKLKMKSTPNNKPSSSYLIKKTNHRIYQELSKVKAGNNNLLNKLNFMIGLSVYIAK